MQDSTFSDALKQFLQDQCTPMVVRAIESEVNGKQHQVLWQMIESLGFADAMRGEAQGGADMSLSDAFALFLLCGQYALPVPLAETIVARTWLEAHGVKVPLGSITLATGSLNSSGDLSCNNITSGRVCNWVLVTVQSAEPFSLLIPSSAGVSTVAVFPTDANLTWQADIVSTQTRLPAIESTLNLACIYSAQLAGALVAVFDRTLQFANDRQQFGKPIGKFQAIQHQLSVMAEHVFAARMAAQIACHSFNAKPNLHRVAVGKARTSEAALEVAALSHSIHGAIGFTAEFDLQLLTRRLHLWRQAAGSESYWHTVLGQSLISQQGMALDLIRSTTDIL
jgi:acyl-CoA dehydrogenase